ncbi:collagen-binding protein [Bombiscardovia nodaiensis]|uniref:Collagen-binding protein n=1 Tax=Bombiscardovia nodaiensis TaxID=2932181 RepID=A0ABN6SF94_9BIFI|nr:collagen-binding protein [Bombiscardovia nodaiensis]
MTIRSVMRTGAGLLATVATLVGVSLLGVSTASADTEVPNLDLKTTNATITINGSASAVQGHSFKAVRIGIYQSANVDVSGNGGKLTSISVGTDTAVKTMAENALNQIDPSAPAPAFVGNPVGEVASEWLGFKSQGTVGVPQGDITSNDANHAWAGNLREFVTKLAADAGFASLVTASTYSATGSGSSAVFQNLPQGLYVVVDTTASGGTSSNSIPILVGTAVGVTASFPGYTQFKGETSPTAPILGKVQMKNDEPTVSKKAIQNSNTGSSASIGGYVQYEITGTVPLTTGYQHYKYVLVDTPDAGLRFSRSNGHQVEVTSGPAGGTQTTINEQNGGTPGFIVDAHSDGSVNFNLSPVITALTPGDQISVKYYMQLTDDATGGVLKNNVKLEYSNDQLHQPSDDRGNGGSENSATAPVTQAENAYFYRFELGKHAKADSRDLAGASFSVKVKGTSAALKFHQVKDAQGVAIPGRFKLAADQTASGDDVLFVSDGSYAGTHPDQAVHEGHLLIDGLGAGEYTVSEINPPNTFSGMFKPSFDVTIKPTGVSNQPSLSNTGDAWDLVSAGSWTYTATDPVALFPASGVHVISVFNVSSLSQLPMTGGAGIILAVMVALVALALAGILFALKRWRDARQL